MDTPTYVVVLIAAGSREEAECIATALVQGRKAACVNIIPGVQSLFRWQGKPEKAEECLLLVKTRASQVPEIVTLVKALHSYTVPEIIAMPIVAGSQDYLDWIGDETG